jgi:hypothetical protein
MQLSKDFSYFLPRNFVRRPTPSYADRMAILSGRTNENSRYVFSIKLKALGNLT